MYLNRLLLVALAWIGASAAVLVATFLPLPRAVLSEEELAAWRMPQTRQAVEQANITFKSAEAAYRDYVRSNDVGAALTRFEQAADALKSASDQAAARATVQEAAAPVGDYLDRLAAYTQAGEQYFTALRHYDDELMSWTRSLGQESEALRSATWPIVEYLKLYPPAVGLVTDYRWWDSPMLTKLIEQLSTNVQTGSAGELLPVADGIRQAGRSVEYIESLHPKYEQLLRDYDGNLQLVLAARASVQPDASRTMATALDLAVAVLAGLGIAGLLLPRTRRYEEAQS